MRTKVQSNAQGGKETGDEIISPSKVDKKEFQKITSLCRPDVTKNELVPQIFYNCDKKCRKKSKQTPLRELWVICDMNNVSIRVEWLLQP